MPSLKKDKSSWIIGGGVLIGLGVGFIFLGGAGLLFVGSLISGLGGGIIVAGVMK